MKKLIWIFLFTSLNIHAGVFFNYSLNYHSETDSGDAEIFSLSKMNNSIMIGGSLDKAGKLILGQNFTSWTKTQEKGAADQAVTLTLLELGPRVLYYFTQERRWYISLTYNFSVKGTGEQAGVSSDVEGTSTMASIGYHLKLTKRFAMGASVKYHNTTITSRSTGSTKTEVTDSFSSIYPMFEAVLRY